MNMDTAFRPVVAIAGAGGRLGRTLVRAYSRRFHVLPVARADVDLADRGRLADWLDRARFDVLVNCAAIADMDFCERNPALADAVNELAVEVMAACCRRSGRRLIQIGTDYVFDGEKRSPYTEDDPCCPISVYGTSKLHGENAALAADPSNVVARVSWLFGSEKESFPDQILRRALEQEKVVAVGDKWSAPTHVLDVARLLEPIISGLPVPGGIVHIAGRGVATWQTFGQHVLDCAAEAGLPLKARTADFIPMSAMDQFVARRPVYSVLSTAKIEALTGLKPRHWKDSVAEHVRSRRSV